MEGKSRKFRRNLGLKVKKFVSKNLGISVVGPRQIFGLDRAMEEDKKPDEPFIGIWHYCQSCEWFGFVDVYDPWSYSSRSYCGNCGIARTYNPNDLLPTISPAHWEICWDIVKERFPEGRRRKFEFFKLNWFGLDEEAIPVDRGNQTLSDLELHSMFMRTVMIGMTLKP